MTTRDRDRAKQRTKLDAETEREKRSRTGKTATYAEIVEAVARRLQLTQKTTRELVEVFFAELGDAVWKSGWVQVPGLGVFRVKKRKGRRIVDPNNLDRTMRLPAGKVVTARVSAQWRTR